MNNYFCTNSGCTPQTQQAQQQSQKQSQKHEGCTCGEDFRRALELLCGDQLRPLIDFDTFAFVTGFYILGTPLDTPAAGTAPGDNLADPAGSYVCGSDSCESVTVSGLLYPPQIGSAALETVVTQVALCGLNAIAFEAVEEDDDPCNNFQTISQILSQLLRPHKPHDCGSMIDALTNAAAIRSSTVVTGPLVVENSATLGSLGDILVLANSTDARFYFICADKIDFIG